MSKGGKYILENFSFKNQDELLLNRRTLENEIKKKCGPVLKRVETHETYIKKYYKPIIPIAFEFKRETAETGNLSFGKNRFSLHTYGDFTCRIFLTCKLSGLSVLNPLDRCGFVDFLGHKLIKKVTMEFAGNIIDEYTGEAYNIYYNYFVSDDKKKSWLRAVGQEIPENVYLQQDDLDEYRVKTKIVFGPQTPKIQHDEINLTIPIIFDFCLKTPSSIFSSKIPFGQKFLLIELNNPEELIFVQDNGGGGQVNLPIISGNINVENIFLDPVVVSALKPGIYRNLIRVYRETEFQSDLTGTFKLDQFRFPIEHIFFGLRPNVNTGPTNWWKFHLESNLPITFPVRLTGDQLAFRTLNLKKPIDTILEAKFMTKSVDIINNDITTFYNCLQPMVKSISPRDQGILMVSFAENTAGEQPTGFYNVSNEREFFINYTANTTGKFYLLSVCLNWIEINEKGEVTLKYNI